MDGGTQVNDACITEFNNLKIGKKYKYIIFHLGADQTIDIEKIGGLEQTWDQFVASLPHNEARYAIFDFHYETNDNPPRKVEKLVFVFWSPDSQPVKFKMTYATGKEALKKKCQGLSKEVQANSLADLDYAEVLKEVSH